MTRHSTAGAFHRLTIVPLMAGLTNLGTVLAKAEAHERAAGRDPEAMLPRKLAPDMFDLNRQLLYALYLPCDFARHFAEAEPPRAGYDEKSFAEVHASLATVIAYLGTVDAARMDARAGDLVPSFFDGKRGVVAETYAASVTMPDFWFHVTAAYAILRHNGVPLVKNDYLGPIASVPLG
jgi:hypothetical protein